MAKGDEKEDSKFGFKDAAKANETLELLQSHEKQYQLLTVRGLLGRAKRVLTLTKAEDKIKNIKAAMEIFENWLAENSTSKNAKPANTDKVETVPGLGFKDKEAAENTIKVLEGRDPDYQKLAVKGLLGSAKRVLSGTKSEEKIAAINAAIEVLEAFIKDFDNENRGKKNMPYLPLDVVEKFPKPTDPLVCEFLAVYRAKDGNYKHLRALFPKDDDSTSWDIVRNRNLLKVKEEYDEDPAARLFDSEGAPSEAHLKMIYWAYSPSADKVKSHAQKLEGSAKKGKNEKKRKASTSSSGSEDADDDEEMEKSPSKKTKKH